MRLSQLREQFLKENNRLKRELVKANEELAATQAKLAKTQQDIEVLKQPTGEPK